MELGSGQAVTYFGGVGAGVVAQSTQAQPMPSPETIPLMAYPVPVIEVTLGDVVALGGFIVVVIRFCWDVWRWKRKQEMKNYRIK